MAISHYAPISSVLSTTPESSPEHRGWNSRILRVFATSADREGTAMKFISDDNVRVAVDVLSQEVDDDPELRTDLVRSAGGLETQTNKPAWSSWI